MTPLLSYWHHYKQTVIQVLICLVWFLAPFWWKLNDAPPPFTANYVTGFVIFWLMLLTIIIWIIAGLPNIEQLWQNIYSITLTLLLSIFLIWVFISQSWAFVSDTRPEIAQNTTLQFFIIFAFILVILTNAPPTKYILSLLIASLLIHGFVGSLQVALQGTTGLPLELTFDPLKSGTSVIEANGIRWLRPYGFVPHPNIFAGIITLGLIASFKFALTSKRIIAYVLCVFGFYILLLTFSRGAWAGFSIATLLILPILLRHLHLKSLIPLFGILITTGLLFVVLYQPFVLSRSGIGQQNTELRSIADRIVFMEIAESAITEYPLTGIGIGNFPWYASDYLYFQTDYDLRGDNVHNIYLLIMAELGIIGIGLIAMFIVLSCAKIIYALWRKFDLEIVALFTGFLAFAIIGLVDHYMWTMIHFQMMWIGLLAICLHHVLFRPNINQL